MKSFILEQFLLIKQNQKLVNEPSISDNENNSEFIKSLLDQIEYLKRENSIKSNRISNLLSNNKVLFNSEENFFCISNNSNLNGINNQNNGTRKTAPWRIAPRKIAPSPNPKPTPNPTPGGRFFLEGGGNLTEGNFLITQENLATSITQTFCQIKDNIRR